MLKNDGYVKPSGDDEGGGGASLHPTHREGWQLSGRDAYMSPIIDRASWDVKKRDH